MAELPLERLSPADGFLAAAQAEIQPFLLVKKNGAGIVPTGVSASHPLPLVCEPSFSLSFSSRSVPALRRQKD
jgi:hypothetical protein